MKTDLQFIIDQVIAMFRLQPNTPTQFAVLNPDSDSPTLIVKDLHSDDFYLIDYKEKLCMKIGRDKINLLISYVQDGCPRDRDSKQGQNPLKNEMFKRLQTVLPTFVTNIRLDDDDSSYLLIASHIMDTCLLIIAEPSGRTVAIRPDDLITVHIFLTTPITLPPLS